jgi:deoxyribodipyrimidine photolyase-related protein
MGNSFQSRLGGPRRTTRSARRLFLVLGDQLDRNAATLRALDRGTDVVLMTEVGQEAEHVPSHRQRTTLFLTAMRHFALRLAKDGTRVRYVTLDDPANTQAFDTELARAVKELSVEAVTVIKPGEQRVEALVRDACAGTGVPLEIADDDSFTCSLDEFDAWAEGRRDLVMEYFYRQRRKKLDILVTDGKPEGGSWNYDKDNRHTFKSDPEIPALYKARPDQVTREVMQLVQKTFPAAYGKMDRFFWPVDRDQARRALKKFIAERLANFGTYEDAMWTGEPFLYHSVLSSALNLKLLSPRECVDAAIQAYEKGAATLNNVEGFVRQIIGWREFMRGIYYREGSDYSRRNGLEQTGALPAFFWNAETEMNCLHHCIGEVVEHAYGHHIARLMVIGNFALIAGVHPRAVHEWFLGMYVDGVEWVTAPNVIGMSQHADHGVVATKPYAASGKYIKRMSNYCAGCRYDVDQRTGDDACPFNTYYWDFLIRHRARLRGNMRMKLVMKSADNIAAAERKKITTRARALRKEFGIT